MYSVPTWQGLPELEVRLSMAKFTCAFRANKAIHGKVLLSLESRQFNPLTGLPELVEVPP